MSNSIDILPSSRLVSAKATVMSDWWITDRFGQRRKIRVEMEPVFCASCGKFYGYVPRDQVTFACWLCDPCSESYGADASFMLMPDEVFAKKVEEEMKSRFGRVLTDAELAIAADRGLLGSALEKLDAESPYRSRPH